MAERMGRVSALLASPAPAGRAVRFFLALALALSGSPETARASKVLECLHALTSPALAPGAKKIKCVDNDPACDVDPAVGVCRIQVGACVNTMDASGRCTPRDLDSYLVANVQPDTDARHVFEFMALQDAVNSMALPADPEDVDQCVGPIEMWLPLEVKIGKKSAAYKKSKQTVKATVHAQDATTDADALPIQCVPAPGSDPCDQVTSTLQHLEKHVFAPTCSRQTCHSGPQSDHSLSLIEGESHLNLVGIMPDNLQARLAGKLRVAAGDLGRSFILDKLRGDLLENEGDRMPRGLAKIPNGKIALVEAWIAAGAPATGFVDGDACGTP
jgi:hypothetical protein